MSIRGCGRLSFFVAMMGSLSLVGAECGGGDDNAAGTGNASSDLAGTWCLIKTLVTATEDHPAGKQFPLELVFVVHGNSATMSTPGVSGSAEGTLSEGVWTFTYEIPIAPGLTSLNQVQVISTSPFKGTEEHRYYDQFGQQIGLEASTLEGWRKTTESCW
ncbi:MAG TPA: hypothetical protein PLJ27_03315 [Polyangiaceae bacterium]|jgi:hypothetical protein|nr:MAG: hypothetical protein BWY17_00164 [Deltaproteobacteria bacterium ADurb.Bin207]HNS98292.1 hypothetical protein [Polyangiaceae bacterium]HNZ22705.1 hypothetical protein [Polyangiaceae bacterium]HOD24340.1 hypothetical protein [Polyangiaceae bacterium]HOE49251.1 hypothetical protein [Polyangiaceae bacterium]